LRSAKHRLAEGVEIAGAVAMAAEAAIVMSVAEANGTMAEEEEVPAAIEAAGARAEDMVATEGAVAMVTATDTAVATITTTTISKQAHPF
jgi:hypothetical protein